MSTVVVVRPDTRRGGLRWLWWITIVTIAWKLRHWLLDLVWPPNAATEAPAEPDDVQIAPTGSPN